MIGAIVQIAAHAPLFVLTVIAFYLDLGVGLAFNPALVTLLWVVAAGSDVIRYGWLTSVGWPLL